MLFASCYFYMAYIPKYILILLLTIVVDYFAGIWIEKSTGRRRKIWLFASIAVNLGCLGYFKYYNFFLGNINDISGLFGWHPPFRLLQIILPVGLSFHTFQAMSYTIEVYLGRHQAERHLGIYALYVMFYPQLVAGPIERPQNLLWQFKKEHKFDVHSLVSGLRLMLWGFFKKVVVADRAAQVVNIVYDRPTSFGSGTLIIATVLFAFQVYADFSGYSDIALGAARVMGFDLMVNFKRPYLAKDIPEFWRRWHISLSTWLRDYLLVPLFNFSKFGGSRHSTNRWFLNLIIVFCASGLWHGASWTYVFWGLLNGGLVVLSLATKKRRDKFWRRFLFPTYPLFSVFIGSLKIAWTFILINISWVFFRTKSLADSFGMLTKIVTDPLEHLDSRVIFAELTDAGVNSFHVKTAVVVSILLILMEIGEEYWEVSKKVIAWPMFYRYAVYYAAVLSILYLGVYEGGQFFYFQF